MNLVAKIILKSYEFTVFKIENEGDYNPYKIFMSKNGKTSFVNNYANMGSVLAWIGDLQNGTISCRDDRTIDFELEELY